MVRRARWFTTDRTHGDFAAGVGRTELDRLCRSLVDAPWSLLDQVHGDRVIAVPEPGARWGDEGDALVTTCTGAVLAVRTADCAAVVLIGRDGDGGVGSIGIAHAGWRGLLGGILQRTTSTLRDLGAGTVEWFLGPCISPAAYEFSRGDLDPLVHRYGPQVASITGSGAPAFDMAAAVGAAMSEVDAVAGGVIPGVSVPDQATRCGVTDVSAIGTPPIGTHMPTSALRPLCTASHDRYYSWRARSESGRQVTAVWLEDEKRPISGRAVQRADGATN